MRILVTGVQNVVKDSMVKLALERLEGRARIKVLSFSDFMEEDGKGMEELKMLKETQKKMRDSIQMSMLKAGAGQHMLINGYCTVKTKMGYVPVMTRESVDIFRPDVIVHVHVDPIALAGKIGDPQVFEEHQAVERSYAISLAANSGSTFSLIKSGKEGARKGSEELLSLLRNLVV
jgi:adenylate kinase